MAICTKCGNIFPDNEADTHVCDPNAIPAAGTERKPTTTVIQK